MRNNDMFFIKMINEKRIDAYSTLYLKYYNSLVLYTKTFVERQDIAEDIVQDIIMHIWEQEITFTDEYSFRVYLYNSLKNRAINYLNHLNVENKYIDYLQNQPSEFESLDEKAFLEEAYRQLFTVIDELPGRQREIFLLHLAGKKNDEIALTLGITTGTVKTHKKRALELIRKKLPPFIFFSLFIDYLL